MTKYEANKWYPTRNGFKAIIYDLNYHMKVGAKMGMIGKVARPGQADIMCSWNVRGICNTCIEDEDFYNGSNDDYDIMLGHSSFHNFYEGYVSGGFESKEEAEEAKAMANPSLRDHLGILEITICRGEVTTKVLK